MATKTNAIGPRMRITIEVETLYNNRTAFNAFVTRQALQFFDGVVFVSTEIADEQVCTHDGLIITEACKS